jgi:hypothetical protein
MRETIVRVACSMRWCLAWAALGFALAASALR